jgi:hypothetical protein
MPVFVVGGLSLYMMMLLWVETSRAHAAYHDASRTIEVSPVPPPTTSSLSPASLGYTTIAGPSGW